MPSNSDAVLQQLAAISLEKCLLRLSRVAAGTWEMRDIKVLPGTLAEALAGHGFQREVSAVHISLRSAPSVSALMTFDHEDIQCVSTAFTGLSFAKSERTTPAEEVMLLELGNIVLNALLSSVLNALKRSAMPAVPQFAEGGASGLAGRLGDADPGCPCRVLKGTLVIRAGGRETSSVIFALIPAVIAFDLEKAATAGNVPLP